MMFLVECFSVFFPVDPFHETSAAFPWFKSFGFFFG